MGRIEDALQKLQKAGAANAAPSSRATGTPVRLASIVAQEHEYGGKRVVIDSVQLRDNGLLAPDTEERRLAEQYRVIKRPLLRNADRGGAVVIDRGNLIMVASALSGEGKTFTCLNLSLSIAREKDWSVVLVDGDCSKPQLTRLFAAENEAGLVDLLREPALSFDSLVMPTDVPGLSILPAGSSDPHASELLASNRMDELCSSLSQEPGRIVIFDSSPLLLTTESVVLASKVGQIAIVVRANSTPRQAVLSSLDKLDPKKAIGCVLNQTQGTESGPGYGDYGAAGN
jgi:exopolysaccharide/PEP-CTERM locus tyrosine autokinase